MTVLSGAASFAPSAAPMPQPSPPAGEEPKYVRGVRKHPCVGSKSYSSTRIVFSSTRSPTHLLTQTISSGFSLWALRAVDRKSTRLNSSHLGISYAVFCLKKKKKKEYI